MSGIKTGWVVTALVIVLAAGGLFYLHKRSSEPFGPPPQRITFKAAMPAGFTQAQGSDFNETALKPGVDPAVALIRLDRTGTGTIWIAEAAGLDPDNARDRADGFGNASSETNANGYSVSHYLDGEPGQLGGTEHYRLEGHGHTYFVDCKPDGSAASDGGPVQSAFSATARQGAVMTACGQVANSLSSP